LKEISLDSFLYKAHVLAEKQELVEKVDLALKQGYIDTPRSFDQPTFEERSDQIAVIVRVMYRDFNSREKKIPRYIGWIVNQSLRMIKEMKREGQWKHAIPSRRSLERSCNYSADIRRYKEEGVTPLICIRPGYYFCSPRKFGEDTRKKLEELFEEFNRMTKEEWKKLKEDQMK
jgi:hypothetical protein